MSSLQNGGMVRLQEQLLFVIGLIKVLKVLETIKQSGGH